MVTCTDNPPSVYTVGGTVSGLSGTVVLQNNGGDDLSVTADGSFTFATGLADGATFLVTVKTNPTGQTCTVANGSGAISAANYTGVVVTCVTNTTQYHLGGTVTGLAAGKSMILRYTVNENHEKTLTASGDFDLGQYTEGIGYSASISTQPSGQRCSITEGASGTVNSSSAHVIKITCVDGTHTLTARIHDLNDTIRIDVSRANSPDNNNTTVTADGTQPLISLEMLRGLSDGDSYFVYISHPGVPHQNCVASPSSGTINGDTTFEVNCHDFISANDPFKVSFTNVSSVDVGSQSASGDHGLDVNFDVDCNGNGASWVTGQQYYICDYTGSEGDHTIWVKGKFPVLKLEPTSAGNYGEYNVTINHWGDQQWIYLEGAFAGYGGKVTVAATDKPDLNATVSMANMFYAVTVSDTGGQMGSWDVSHVSDMSAMFYWSEVLEDTHIGNWDVSHVANMNQIFCHSALHADITQWHPSSVTDMSYMFDSAFDFDQDISSWKNDLATVTKMDNMFGNGDGTEPPNYDHGIFTSWDMKFDHDLDEWLVPSVTSHNNFKYSGATFAEPVWP